MCLFCIGLPSVVPRQASSALAVSPLFRVGLRRLWLSVHCSASGFVGSGCQSVVRPLFCVGLRRLWLSVRCSASGSMCVRKFVLGVVRCSVSDFVGSGCQSVVLCRASSALAVSPLFCVGLRRLWLSVRCSASGSMCVRKFVLGVYNFNIKLTYFLCVHKNALMLIHIHLQIMGRQCIERKKIRRKESG